MHRRKTKKVFFADVAVGGDSPISIQSMTNTKTTDVKNTVKQIHKLEKAGCELIRVAIPDIESAKKIKDIKDNVSVDSINKSFEEGVESRYGNQRPDVDERLQPKEPVAKIDKENK